MKNFIKFLNDNLNREDITICIEPWAVDFFLKYQEVLIMYFDDFADMSETQFIYSENRVNLYISSPGSIKKIILNGSDVSKYYHLIIEDSI